MTSTRPAPTQPPVLRPIEPRDDPAVAAIIRTVMPEFGAKGPGFAINDPEVDVMCATYRQPRSLYLVWELDGRVVGGGGVGPLAGAAPDTCELRKMYVLREARGRGWGEILLRRLLAAARELEYATCYLETLTGMEAAQKLYERMGFARLPAAMGATGHFGCNRYYSLDLRRGPRGDGDL
jgi:putative acetyltransferase